MSRLPMNSNSMVVLVTMFLLSAVRMIESYPIIMEIHHNDRQCIDLNIPDGDDAHLLFIPVNEDIHPGVEDWYVSQMSEITRHESTKYLKDLDPYPANVHNAQSRVTKSNISLYIEQIDAHPPVSKTFNLSYFKLLKLEHIAEMLSTKKGWNRNLGQYSICIAVRGKKEVRILFDAHKISEYEEKMAKRHLMKKEHLTPLEEAFEEGVALSHTVLDEMNYMEKREQRMKLTTDGTNARIRYFSYLSVMILLGVTWVQIQYLKNYFKKKKIL